MSRSRSSFDLAGAIATAASLSAVAAEDAAVRRLPRRGAGLVRPHRGRAAPEPLAPPAPRCPPPAAPREPPPVAARGAASRWTTRPMASDRRARAGRPSSPISRTSRAPCVRCQKIIEWIDRGRGRDRRLHRRRRRASPSPAPSPTPRRASRPRASSPRRSRTSPPRSPATPRRSSSCTSARARSSSSSASTSRARCYVVGFTRATPLSYRQAHAVRLACRHALGGRPGTGAAHAGATRIRPRARAGRPGARTAPDPAGDRA